LELIESGQHVEALLTKPTLYDDLVNDYRAFIDLSASRQTGMVEGAIPLSEIYAYMQIFEIAVYAQRKLFLQRMRFLDKIYLDFVHKESEKK
jgi:hypothetical protein